MGSLGIASDTGAYRPMPISDKWSWPICDSCQSDSNHSPFSYRSQGHRDDERRKEEKGSNQIVAVVCHHSHRQYHISSNQVMIFQELLWNHLKYENWHFKEICWFVGGFWGLNFISIIQYNNSRNKFFWFFHIEQIKRYIIYYNCKILLCTKLFKQILITTFNAYVHVLRTNSEWYGNKKITGKQQPQFSRSEKFYQWNGYSRVSFCFCFCLYAHISMCIQRI